MACWRSTSILWNACLYENDNNLKVNEDISLGMLWREYQMLEDGAVFGDRPIIYYTE
jgi:hypothetical protein